MKMENGADPENLVRRLERIYSADALKDLRIP